MSTIKREDNAHFTVTVFGDYSYTGTFYSAANEYIEDARSAGQSLSSNGKYAGIVNKYPLAPQEQILIELWKTIPKNIDDDDYIRMVSQLSCLISFLVSGDIELFYAIQEDFEEPAITPTAMLVRHLPMLRAICGPVETISYGAYWTSDDTWVGEDDVDEITDRDTAEAEWLKSDNRQETIELEYEEA